MGRELVYRGRLLLYAAAAALGGAVGCAGPLSPLWIIIPGTSLLLVACLARIGKRGLAWLLPALLMLFIGLYLGGASYAGRHARSGPAGEVALAGEVEVGSRGEAGDEAVILEVTEVLEGENARPGDRYLLRPSGEGAELPSWGDSVEARGFLYIFPGGGGDADGSFIASEIKVTGQASNPFLGLALSFREEVRERAGICLDDDAAGLVEGMLLGDYRHLGAQDLLALRSSGLIHICAASGLHVGVLVMVMMWLGRKLALPRRAAMVLQAPVLVIYALAVGLTVPVQRAAAVAIVAVIAFLAGRDFDFLPALGIALFYMIARDAGAASSVSLQLSFAAALGVVLLHRPIGDLLRTGNSRALKLLAATLAAQLAVAPLLMHHFGEVSLLAPLSNLLALPLVPVVMALAMLSSLLGLLGLPLAWLPMRAAGPAADWVLTVARITSAPRWASLHVASIAPVWMAVYYPVLACALLAAGSYRRMARVALTSLLALGLMAGGFPPLQVLGGVRGVRVTFIDVGQGDAVLMQAPSGAAVLVDGGEDERELYADLRSRGIDYLDVVMISHPEQDHIGGLEGALDCCGVGMLVHPGTKSEGTAGRLLSRAVQAGIPVRVMREGDTLRVGELEFRAHGPPAQCGEDVPLNDYSLVLSVDAPGLDLLLTGDVEEEGQDMLMDHPGEIACDILKVPHHGGFAETGEEFFAMADPEIAVVCLGADNPYGHPSSETMHDLRRLGCIVYRTDRRGDIVIHVVEGGYRVECER